MAKLILATKIFAILRVALRQAYAVHFCRAAQPAFLPFARQKKFCLFMDYEAHAYKFASLKFIFI